MKLTQQQHLNIANGMDRMRNHCLVAKDDAKYYYAQEEGTLFSTRFKTYQYKWGKKYIFDDITDVKNPS